MTYPPGPPSGPGFGGDPNAHGQQPQENPAWWDQPATPQGQPVWPQQQPVDPTWQQQGAQPGWQQPVDQGAWQGQPQQNWGGQPGYPQQPGYPPPPKSNTGLIVGIVLGVVAVLAVAVGAIVFVTRGDDSSQAGGTSTTTTTTTTTETTTTRPPTTTKAAPAGKKFTYTEYGQPWNFRLGDVALQADWVEGHDYPSCSQLEKGGKLTGLGCQYASELVWKAENGGVMLTQLIFTMSDEAKATAADGKFDDGDLKFPDGSYINDWETGKWRDGSQSQFLVVTLATATAAVDTETVEKYLRYRHSDTLGALVFR
ncbi:hypothetical protein AB0N05_11510 [Nocardia sp. NPDC051030]|uniref:hypothetical protein n=1 Tax=Nocardia sp. NPDC051030 TaxID=3155162 RepID=UPI00341ADB93